MNVKQLIMVLGLGAAVQTNLFAVTNLTVHPQKEGSELVLYLRGNDATGKEVSVGALRIKAQGE